MLGRSRAHPGLKVTSIRSNLPNLPTNTLLNLSYFPSPPPSAATRCQGGSPRPRWRIWRRMAALLPNARQTTWSSNLGGSGRGQGRTAVRNSVTWPTVRAGAHLDSKSLGHKEKGSQQTENFVVVPVQRALPSMFPWPSHGWPFWKQVSISLRHRVMAAESAS